MAIIFTHKAIKSWSAFKYISYFQITNAGSSRTQYDQCSLCM